MNIFHALDFKASNRYKTTTYFGKKTNCAGQTKQKTK